ncbi:hypothetical protein M427DRAFT_352362 [Gonapodya prolifera JEL478]|uniref:Uncharacterized protein n=1 Tax=Gonapodya prolifera (strain JEL478) TaxID=1344416 RepID=A0A139ABW3_GONPJ|nr:hypothetical protein M427DRAFT_352362 [Gonapodya prolifera JEL478]|eukprot:KXS14247.1 hypothetical protein M427DRAFT_352362 [Gonapodya prolifera JEL478]
MEREKAMISRADEMASRVLPRRAWVRWQEYVLEAKEARWKEWKLNAMRSRAKAILAHSKLELSLQRESVDLTFCGPEFFQSV